MKRNTNKFDTFLFSLIFKVTEIIKAKNVMN